MKLYFASKWGMQERVVDLYHLLDGAVTTSSWLSLPRELDSSKAGLNERWAFAHTDLRDIEHADVLVLVNGLMTGDPYGPAEMQWFPSSPGRFLELGYALALGKPCWVIGDKPYSVFYAHPLIRMFKDDDEFIEWFHEGRP